MNLFFQDNYIIKKVKDRKIKVKGRKVRINDYDEILVRSALYVKSSARHSQINFTLPLKA